MKNSLAMRLPCGAIASQPRPLRDASGRGCFRHGAWWRLKASAMAFRAKHISRVSSSVSFSVGTPRRQPASASHVGSPCRHPASVSFCVGTPRRQPASVVYAAVPQPRPQPFILISGSRRFISGRDRCSSSSLHRR